MPLLHQSLYWAALLLACGFTIWAGGWPERIGLAITIVASLVSYAAEMLMRSRWHHLMPETALVDVATSLAFLVLMLRSKRFWPIWAFGFCLAMLMAHAMRALEGMLPAWAYYHSEGIWAYPVMGAVMAGAAARRWGSRITGF